MFEEAADFTQGEVKAYRKFAFPDALAVPGHDPFFSVEDAPSWVTSHGFQLYLTYDDSAIVTSPWTPDNASATQLKAYRSYILSDQYLGHPYTDKNSPGGSNLKSTPLRHERPTWIPAARTLGARLHIVWSHNGPVRAGDQLAWHPSDGGNNDWENNGLNFHNRNSCRFQISR
ncbi:hypothetical protein C8F04DRAFT_1116120 [Mycena alexandri]|uniref:Uncharacterized protein n=1 Tax=Mycena alexandri TaxID=1745969 RepID=A0AAD6SN75_9AGAR|nr:hypothetical protein C8F04DRAFT_1116120 [Mycena alexandri]